ncbi:MAG TPA: ABC transporter permease [Candidatus Dormibacteraeota bacterium]|nr:ABC transporter permease [Candidatus Dormibacteraeota bacterium]
MVGLAAVIADAQEPWVRWNWVITHTGVIWDATLEHIILTVVAVVVGLVIATPLGLLAWRSPRWREPILGFTGTLYVIPSLALFALLIPFLGLTLFTAEVGLVSYTLLILVRNIVVGLDAVPPEVREAAKGMGYSRQEQLLGVELPLALPAIMAGVRIATVTTIGLVTVTALIGEGGLGRLILQGLINDFRTPLVIGAVLSVCLAIVADVSLGLLQRAVTPWARVRPT